MFEIVEYLYDSKIASFKNSYQSQYLHLKKLEPNFESIFSYFIRPRSVIVEIGSCIGRHSIVLAKSRPKCDLYLFEANPDTFVILNANLHLNNIQNTKAINCALIDKKQDTYIESIKVKNLEGGIMDGVSNPFNIGGCHLGKIDTEGNFQRNDNISSRVGAKIPGLPLDSFNLSNVSFIKIDVEMSECQVLRGAEETIDKCRPVILIELTDKENEDKINVAKYCFEWLSSRHYIVFNSLTMDLLQSFIVRDNYGQIDALCFPKENYHQYSEGVNIIRTLVQKNSIKKT